MEYLNKPHPQTSYSTSIKNLKSPRYKEKSQTIKDIFPKKQYNKEKSKKEIACLLWLEKRS
jgi:hypothetical protein